MNITAGFKQCAKKMISDLEGTDAHNPYTHAPFLVMSSRQDRYISDRKLLRLSNKIGPMGTLLQIQHAEHDLLCSFDMEKTRECIDYMTSWLKNNFESLSQM